MKIGIFSKLEMLGGSERRSIELANGINKFSNHETWLISEKIIKSNIKNIIDPKIKLINGLDSLENNLDKFYELDHIIIINTDCKEFCTEDYWLGKTQRHSIKFNLNKIKSMIFLFNFIVSPSRHLYQLENYGINIKIITANNKFFNEISEQDRYEKVRHYPRIQLATPINPDSISTEKEKSNKIRLGYHSKGLENKWNNDITKWIKSLNDKYKNNEIEFHFMGMEKKIAKALENIPNVHIYKENYMSVKEFLKKIDIFVFYIDYKREEPFSRAVCESMMSGKPIITIKKGGNVDQVIHGNNGFLCKSINDFIKYSIYLIEHPSRIEFFGKNSIRISENYKTEKVIPKLLRFLNDNNS